MNQEDTNKSSFSFIVFIDRYNMETINVVSCDIVNKVQCS